MDTRALRAQFGETTAQSRGTAARPGTVYAAGSAFAGRTVRDAPNPFATSGPDVAGPVIFQNLSGERQRAKGAPSNAKLRGGRRRR